MVIDQGGRCPICQRPLSIAAAVLDHDHNTGAIRAALHRGCNSLLGKLENNAARYGVVDLAAFAAGVPSYIRKHFVNVTGLIHPLHKTPDEKRLARNAKARKTRAANKVAA